jgi:hypothetical protein
MFEQIYKIKRQFEAAGIEGLAVDIDETLSWTVKHWMGQLALRFGNPSGLSVEELIAKYRYTQSVPHWQTAEALSWMEKSIEDDEMQEAMPLIQAADSAIQTIHREIMPVVLYPTVRPEVVRRGTLRWLDKHHFPEAELIMRPTSVARTDGNKWKAKVLEILYPQVKGIIDDNPGLPLALSTDYQGVVLLYDNAEVAKTNIRVIPCKSWQDVINNARQVFKQS